MYRVALIPLLSLAAACGPSDRSRRPVPSDAGTDTSVSDMDSGLDVDGGLDMDAASADAGPRLDDVLIYSHSRDTLYSFSPFTNTVTEIGVFQLPTGEQAPFMLDLAVDSNGVVFTCSDDTLFSVDPLNAEATAIGTFGLGADKLYALSFLSPSESPDGTEALIGATNAGTYYQIDRSNASTRMLGSYPDGWMSSGDIVSVDGGTYATLRSTDFTGDVLARIIFARDGSSSVVVIGPIKSATEDFKDLFGLAYWGRDVYGFSNTGQLIRIDRATGAAEVVTTGTGADQFWGAGVTTIVPVLI
ncbi:MAG: hypothetical protein GXP55_04925 [Deltaproteobacteria bacterium]|nr:hypothetical protein [Deltaproteobacteria bacterium]